MTYPDSGSDTGNPAVASPARRNNAKTTCHECRPQYRRLRPAGWAHPVAQGLGADASLPSSGRALGTTHKSKVRRHAARELKHLAGRHPRFVPPDRRFPSAARVGDVPSAQFVSRRLSSFKRIKGARVMFSGGLHEATSTHRARLSDVTNLNSLRRSSPTTMGHSRLSQPAAGIGLPRMSVPAGLTPRRTRKSAQHRRSPDAAGS